MPTFLPNIPRMLSSQDCQLIELDLASRSIYIILLRKVSDKAAVKAFFINAQRFAVFWIS
ncbi:MAG: hypothetical protein R3A44_29075 [Caldilineaceae bacterium]